MLPTPRIPGRSVLALWARRGSIRFAVMGIMVIVAVLSGCSSSGGQVDTAATSATAAGGVTAPTGGAATASAAPSAGASAASLSARLPSGAYLGMAPAMRGYDRAPAVLALRNYIDKRTFALLNMNPLYGPYAASASGALLTADRAFITQLKTQHARLHGRAYYVLLRVARPSPTEVVLDTCQKDNAAYFVTPDGKPVQGVVTDGWIFYRYTVDFLAGRWVPTNYFRPETTGSYCVGAT